ncbi:imelysin family protein [Pseudosulfitobacter pseudonitzschiae]|uniref:imelysin family protein n=1 Tax=Pseudosulfitobacter pseudonitzschiae TaxID=1402135 RepID=UPI001AFB458E|nr:imelysin family protein [Pseudosulfitobacter pseudonitzschiae]MBM1815112.1 peptidase [Pseudosulfitobacter pseudonitzschiae]MBM1832103.1 peptidase [Pseudosulfitobacter pseudonitzschiae]MBM1836971.1 peptidase [Pseudosulfitobacter pseudonitzschiae]MBM1841817.1 peptidase [Pseudosulfitobacter pseudonitzschiae]MBM1846685.1 peptidase [Pseudosulfitobacter pseudonitzschiae]
MKRLFLTTAISLTATASFADTRTDVLANYADIAAATYGDSLTTAQALQVAVDALVADPSETNLIAARSAWLAARVPYQQSEVFRFGNPIVDDWEGGLNAWPLDEGLIDYVDASYGGATDENEAAALNVIANPTFTLSGTEVDATEITPDLLKNTLQEADGVEANVATGYHAIEFLLWGQDLNGNGPGAGNRPWTDYATGDACTNGNCDRRGAYLQAATQLLVSDLEWMTEQWADGGEARANVMADENAGISAMLTGMGSLSYGEQAGERMRLGLMLNDPEEEHDCFSDNTHNSHYYDGLGIQNVYLGSYTRIDGSTVSGPSLSALVAETDTALDTEMRLKLATTMRELGEIKSTAEAGMAYDQMLEAGNAAGEELVMGGVNALIDQTRSIERVVTALGVDGIAFEGSDSLDNPGAVFE